MAKAIMVQGTMSNAGKSLLAAGLCRIFKQDGYRVAPFKSQNMALNSFITEEGLEMGRAQVMQAEAAGIKPSVLMNPILLKPTNDVGSQVIVNGEVLGTMSARDYFKYKKKLVPDIMKAYNALAAENDIIVIEGAGSPAEINLKTEDIVNMGMAKMAKAPVLLVGDIDRGGVFAQLIGTVELLEEDEREMVKGLIINKFRGDKTILDPGVEMLEKRKHRSDNTSGFRGIYHMNNGKYRATIGFKGKRFYIGTFKNYEDAVQARLEAENTIHGGFVQAWYTWNSLAEKDPKWAEEHPLVYEIERVNGEFQVITNMNRQMELPVHK